MSPGYALNNVKVPEGYFLRHHEQPHGPPYRGVVLCRKDETVADLEFFRCAATDRWRFGTKLRDGKRFYDYDIDKLFFQTCVYHRLTGGAK